MVEANVRVLSPISTTFTPSKTRPPRPKALAGLRPGLLENSKHNAQLLMELMIEGLRETVELAPTVIGHKGVSLPPSRQTVEMLKRECDFVLVGTADLLGRTVIAPAQLGAGLMTAAIGTPYFLYLLVRGRRQGR